MMALYTIGYTKTTEADFFSRIIGARIKTVVDVRLHTASRYVGFAQKNTLRYSLKGYGIRYEHRPELAPTLDMLDDYRKRRCSWKQYEERFRELMVQRKIEETVPHSVMDQACLLCSENMPHCCHRRLVAEYLSEAWGDVEILHL